MAKEFKLKKQPHLSDRSRAAYTKPKLEELGLVREMTLAGSGSSNESVGSTMCADPIFDINEMCTG
jgi:hypothetical protein